MKDLKLDEHTGLVLEGGGMRGVFTCGVLDYLMDHNIRFPYAIGVSAGACNGLFPNIFFPMIMIHTLLLPNVS